MERTIKAWLIVDYRNLTVRTIKRRGKRLGVSEIPVQLKINVEVPVVPELTAEATIKLGRREITELMFEDGNENGK